MKLVKSAVSLVCSGALLAAMLGGASAFGQLNCGAPNLQPFSGGPPLNVSVPSQPAGQANTCDPEVTVYLGLLFTEITIFFPCSGHIDDEVYPVGDAGDARDDLNYICGSTWLNQYFPNGVSAPGSSLGLSPHATTAGIPANGQGSQQIVSVDFNGDGNPDTASISSTGVRVQLLGKDGSVISSNTFPVGFQTTNPLANNIVAADFNGDGKLDLVVSNAGSPGSNSGGAALLLGNGDGTFQSPVAIQAGLNPLSLAVADFNGDGKIDLAAANQSSGDPTGLGPGSISVLLNNGSGAFAAPVTYTAGEDNTGFPDSLIALDLNGDGLPDLAAANRNDKSISVWINSSGAFKPAAVTHLPVDVQYLAYADFNHDGKLDLLAASNHHGALVMLVGNGDGTFQPPVAYQTGNQPNSIGVLPLQDGNTLVFTVDSLTTSIWTTIVSPQAIPGAPPLTFIGGSPTGVAAVDLNSDGQPDAVVVGGSSDVSVVLSKGSAYQSPVGYSLGGSSPQAVAIGDMNNDGKPDVVTANGAGSISVLPGNGDGSLRSPVNTSSLSNPNSLALADWNKDGKLDAAVAAYGPDISVLFGNGDGTFQAPLTLTVAGLNVEAIAAADLNGDGVPDLAAIAVGTPGQPATLAVFLGQPGGKFQAPRTFALQTLAGNQGGIAIGDLNGDGKPDIVAFSNYGTKMDVLLGDGAGGFKESTSLPSTSAANSAAITLADLNGDGKLDLVITGTFLAGNGDGTFQSEQPFLSASYATSVSPTKFGANPGLISVGQAGAMVATAILQPTISPLTISADVSAASSSVSSLAPASIATAYGAGLATGTASAAASPLPISLAQTTVTITDSTGAQLAAPLFYVSPAQVNYEVPAAAAIGPARVTITNGNGNTGSAAVQIAPIAPAIFALDAAGLIAADAIVVAPSGTQQVVNVYQVTSSAIAPLPVDLSTGQVYLAIYATGIRNAKAVTATVAGQSVPVLFWGSQNTYVGLDQVNIGPLPASLQGRGQIDIALTADGQLTNTVNLTIH